MYMYIITEGKVCTRKKTHCKALLACIVIFHGNNVGRLFLPHTPIRIDVTACFRPISYVCSIRVCQVVFELYRNDKLQAATTAHFLLQKQFVHVYDFKVFSCTNYEYTINGQLADEELKVLTTLSISQALLYIILKTEHYL